MGNIGEAEHQSIDFVFVRKGFSLKIPFDVYVDRTSVFHIVQVIK